LARVAEGLQESHRSRRSGDRWDSSAIRPGHDDWRAGHGSLSGEQHRRCVPCRS